jgi:hypothetical protein
MKQTAPKHPLIEKVSFLAGEGWNEQNVYGTGQLPAAKSTIKRVQMGAFTRYFNVQLPGVAHCTDGGLFHIFFHVWVRVCASSAFAHIQKPEPTVRNSRRRIAGEVKSQSNNTAATRLAIEEIAVHPPLKWPNILVDFHCAVV